MAQADLGMMYGAGTGMPLDYAKALFWLRKSANQGHGLGEIMLGSLYESGQGLKPDYHQALVLYDKAARQGLRVAENARALLLFRHPELRQNTGGIPSLNAPGATDLQTPDRTTAASRSGTPSEHSAPPALMIWARPKPPQVSWIHVPSVEDAARYYPDRAERMGVEGQATLRCRLAADGKVSGCEILSETPREQQFGMAAMKMAAAGLFQANATSRPAESHVVVPVRFVLPKTPPATAEPTAGTTP